jgi:hypothetical protein
MIRPAFIGFNTETAVNNHFQQQPEGELDWLLHCQAEFDNLVALLRREHVDIWVVDDTAQPPKPDAVFPNNWLSTTPDGRVFIYPLFAPNRRPEKREDILLQLEQNFVIRDWQDWSEFETQGHFLEGTGSMVMDHANQLIYAALSERTSPALLEKFAAANGYQAIVFVATDRNGHPVYHTNVVMSLGEKHAVLCEEAITEEWELIAVRQLLESTGHTIIPITRDQLHCFAGNMLYLYNQKGEPLIILSETALQSLHPEQREMLEAFGRLVPVAIPTLERIGGGSVRCMMAELFPEKKIRE